jgi:tRNA-5-methyluridine54 2-sulfurtransferase
MRCRVCKSRAAVEVRRHNAAFCRDHFIDHVTRQVERTIHEFDMFTHDDRLVIGVSGGKDSLALWDILHRLGYRCEGVYLDLGIDVYSTESLDHIERFVKERDLILRVVDLGEEYGFTIPKAAETTRRSPCSACGLSKRYILNEEALKGGYDALVMGHNLDDEGATLFSNVLNWNVEYLARQKVVLPSSDGLVKKVKPLVRVAERETAAYAVLSGIEYEVEECPMVAGNTVNRMKEWMSLLEHRSPGVTQRFLGGFQKVNSFDEEERPTLLSCESCGRPTTGTTCAFCRLRARASQS